MSIRSILTHPALLFVCAALTVIIGAVSLWNNYHHKIVVASAFQLDETSLTLKAPAPEWTRVDLVDALKNHFEDRSILDTDVVKSTVDFVETFGWVEDIQRVEKSSSGLKIDLTYREPVAMVDFKDRLLPVDGQGVILDPNLLPPSEVPAYMRVSLFRPLTGQGALHNWQQWPDPRIQQAATIGLVLKDHWQQMQLFRIVTLQLPGERARREPFELWTQGHIVSNQPDAKPFAAKVVWGNAPGYEAQNEAPALAKVAAIQEFIAERGPLFKSVPSGKLLDVRSGKAVLTSKVRTAEQLKITSELR